MVQSTPRSSFALRPPHEEGAEAEERLLPTLELAFAPLHKRAFGVALGSAGAMVVALLTIVALMSPRAQEFPLHLLSEYFAGYSVSWPGVIVGAAWGFAVFFVAGWFFAFCRNLALAVSAFFIRARAELDQTRDFLDHV